MKTKSSRSITILSTWLWPILVATGLLFAGTVWANGAVPFSCTGEAYTVRGDPTQAQLFLIDQTVSPFVFTPIGVGATGPFGADGALIAIQVNNLGYRSTDNLLYAVAMPLSGNFNYGIIQIDSNGDVFPFGPLTGPFPDNVRLLAGDVTPDGSTMYINTYPSSTLYILDLATKVVTTQALTGGAVSVADWAVSPDNGKLYGAAGQSSGAAWAPIYELDPGTGIITNLGQVTNLPVNGSGAAAYYGGSWFNFEGALFVYRNNDWIYEIDLAGTPPTLEADFAGQGVNSSLNDAAACAATDIVKEQVIGESEVGIYTTTPTEFGFEISYSGPATLIMDFAPAEFEVDSCDASGLSECAFFYASGVTNPKKAVNSATVIEWTIPEAGTYTLVVIMDTRPSPNSNKKATIYKPTSCGDLPLNLGATAYQVDEFGGLVLDPEFNPIPLIASNILVVEAIAGTKPCAPTGLTVTLDGADTLKLVWNDNTESVDHYNVYRANSLDGPFDMIAESFDPWYDDTGLTPEKYCYQVKAAFGEGDDAEGNEAEAVCGTVPDPTP